jgi:hypothetical protein
VLFSFIFQPTNSIWFLLFKKTFNPGSNFFIYLKEHPAFVQGFKKDRTSSPVPDLVLQKKFLIGFSFTYLHP